MSIWCRLKVLELADVFVGVLQAAQGLGTECSSRQTSEQLLTLPNEYIDLHIARGLGSNVRIYAHRTG